MTITLTITVIEPLVSHTPIDHSSNMNERPTKGVDYMNGDEPRGIFSHI